jgi:hypothetical protein
MFIGALVYNSITDAPDVAVRIDFVLFQHCGGAAQSSNGPERDVQTAAAAAPVSIPFPLSAALTGCGRFLFSGN